MPQTFAVDPNLVYLILLVGLWGAVTAAYMPGTGIAELGAAAITIFAIVLIATLPTNWLAVLAVMGGVLSFLVMPFLNYRWALLAVGGLLLQALGSILMFNGGVSVSLPLIAVVIGLSLLYHRYILLPVLENQRKQSTMDTDETVVGKRGRVMSALNPIGTVQAAGELWTARSDSPLESGQEVMVVEREGLVLTVEEFKQKRTEHSNGYAEQES
jgi:membrane-bound serine protease (ClpP class)